MFNMWVLASDEFFGALWGWVEWGADPRRVGYIARPFRPGEAEMVQCAENRGCEHPRYLGGGARWYNRLAF